MNWLPIQIITIFSQMEGFLPNILTFGTSKMSVGSDDFYAFEEHQIYISTTSTLVKGW